MPSDVLERICIATGASADWLLLGIGEMLRPETEESPPEQPKRPGYREVPLRTADADTGDEGGYLEIPDVGDDQVFALAIAAASMSPRLNPGDVIFVSPRRAADPRYPIGVVEVAGELLVRYITVRGGIVRLEAENPMVRAIEVPEAECTVLGRAVKAYVGLGG